MEQEAPQADALDRKELLEQQFNEVEGAPERARDEAGRFAPRAEAKAEPNAEVEAPEPAEEPVWSKPPASWKK
jgi:hypothetical protein